MFYVTGGSPELDGQNRRDTKESPVFAHVRRHPRFKLNTDIRVYSRNVGRLDGSTVDISEAGISAMLKLELAVGEVVQLEFELPFGSVAIRALTRHKTAFCYGFQFVEPDPEGVIKETCSHLAAQQAAPDAAHDP